MLVWDLHTGDALTVLRTLPAESVHCCVTSPPYFGLRDYGVAGQIGLEATPDAFVAVLVAVFREVRRVLRDDGTLWLNLGDSYASSPPGNSTKGVSAKSGLNGVNGASGKYRDTLDAGHATKRDTSKVSGLKPKDLIGIPWRVAFALQADGWWLRQDIIWSKPNPMPESVRDRCTKAHEYVFMLSKSARYHYDAEAVAEACVWAGQNRTDDGPVPSAMPSAAPHRGLRKDKQRGHGRRHAGFNERWDAMPKAEQCSGTRNKRSVWEIATEPFPEAHFATYPTALVELCILAGCPKGGTVLDPFSGAGTTGLVAARLGRGFVGIELNPEYVALAKRRCCGPLFAEAGD
ncbi:MAG: site-specific DNA-methyltransferase [Planctomycetota bacterium]|nr:site-specific DNA-methyltransferase [Planctomycetota bacterium]